MVSVCVCLWVWVRACSQESPVNCPSELIYGELNHKTPETRKAGKVTSPAIRSLLQLHRLPVRLQVALAAPEPIFLSWKLSPVREP